MSFGDPNNPYGQQPQAPQGGQPGYGYPQQAPQGIPQQGYGYPQQGAPAGFPGGYPGAPVEMPGGVKGARIMLYILGGLQAIGAVFAIVASAWVADMISGADTEGSLSSADADKAAAIGAGFMIVIGVLILAFALWGILTAVKLDKGRGGIRVSGIIYASIITLFSLLSLLTANIFALISLVLGILIIVFLAKGDASQYFGRPRH
ncbi:hypothetical protein [Streptomyces xanthophaeus]|uniref:hypothetical protein n=1 Tax=Streptomyces xanthophaeus TaxID=67385 RepID=UPI00233F35E5|nr:hypothetical protein [Streptomyces xanthophaeus]WCD88204.1 hypothetical protein KPP03845_104609 [Streptomyces xanthophaeus]